MLAMVLLRTSVALSIVALLPGLGGAETGSAQTCKADGSGMCEESLVQRKKATLNKTLEHFMKEETGHENCAWWFASTNKCELKGLRRRNPDELLICKTSGEGMREGEARKACTGHAGAVSEGDIPNAMYAESFDTENKLGAWTTGGPNVSNEKDDAGNWVCMEDEKYNFVDFNDCSAALPDPGADEKHADQVRPLMACWSCQWVMWYKKEHCKCCNPDELIGKINGEECCDGIDMACGINGHDRRNGTPRGSEVCDDLAGDPTHNPSDTCTHLLKTPKPAYSGAIVVGSGSEGAPYVHTRVDYQTWLDWDPNLCYRHDGRQDLCEAFTNECKWFTPNDNPDDGKCKSIPHDDWANYGMYDYHHNDDNGGSIVDYVEDYE